MREVLIYQFRSLYTSTPSPAVPSSLSTLVRVRSRESPSRESLWWTHSASSFYPLPSTHSVHNTPRRSRTSTASKLQVMGSLPPLASPAHTIRITNTTTPRPSPSPPKPRPNQAYHPRPPCPRRYSANNAKNSRDDSRLVLTGLEVRVGEEEKHFRQLDVSASSTSYNHHSRLVVQNVRMQTPSPFGKVRTSPLGIRPDSIPTCSRKLIESMSQRMLRDCSSHK